VTDLDFTLVHSPLVGPSTWRLVQQSLKRRGFSTGRPSVTLEDLLSGGQQVRNADWARALIVHSAAGFFAPTLAQQTGRHQVIFVDALLPAPGESWLATAPAPLVAHLNLLAADGLLPPWPTWFGASTMARLIPDEQLRAGFEAECSPISLDLLSTPTPRTRLEGRHAYLRLSEGYAEEEERARDLGWLVRHEPLHHLAMLTHPDRIADLIVELAQDL
jgi:hypothetical protein